MADRTIGTLFSEARTLLNDKVAAPTFRYSDAELMEAFNGAVNEVRTKRPDLFLALGLRNAVPFYDAATDLGATFPLDPVLYTPLIYYIVGRSELREDTFAVDGRAVALMNKFVSGILGVAS